ncbi:bifunctional 2-polyprenyl-6-hydroxyphenol methylase/3-demethylubiquinol 3-O-methyltransferase UbiG [Hyphomicrobium sp. ghe19]|uniref:class I SAM-dependent methyltransferase n=1 Tax=Hyphomicrobium sp. ghe19 TaxID=2682968 RepID=UPI0013675CAA|nr:Ubiquinone biosynthesis O-methyltransferase [Hyphomicrobium sp. ghe19]
MSSKDYALRVEKWSASEQWTSEAEELLSRVGLKALDKVLDVGTNTGRMMQLAMRKGAIPFGVEKNAAARYLAQQNGCQVYPTINDAATQHGPFFDVVLLSHVLGHVNDPVDMLWQCVSVTRHGGVIGLLGPNPVYDNLMAPMNALTGYKGDATIQHSIGLMRLQRMLPPWFNTVDVFYLGEKPKWLPGSLLPESTRSRLGVVIRRSNPVE